jgi:hypothetical protein
VQGGERGAVSAEAEQEVTGRDIDRLRDSARLPGDQHLADGDTALRRPVANGVQRPLYVATRVYDESELRRCHEWVNDRRRRAGRVTLPAYAASASPRLSRRCSGRPP